MNIWRGQGSKKQKLKLDLYGTNFQLQVWQALLKIPNGETVTYQDVAKSIGRPKSSRAVGNAVGANPVSLLIPCHRVIRATGIIDNYGWGSPRKKLILALEQSPR
jgi:AraC family transcriptional regulator of adaptative response/methylated-DNA-[protein]-cysteine methyltransferase